SFRLSQRSRLYAWVCKKRPQTSMITRGERRVPASNGPLTGSRRLTTKYGLRSSGLSKPHDNASHFAERPGRRSGGKDKAPRRTVQAHIGSGDRDRYDAAAATVQNAIRRDSEAVAPVVSRVQGHIGAELISHNRVQQLALPVYINADRLVG